MVSVWSEKPHRDEISIPLNVDHITYIDLITKYEILDLYEVGKAEKRATKAAKPFLHKFKLHRPYTVAKW